MAYTELAKIIFLTLFFIETLRSLSVLFKLFSIVANGFLFASLKSAVAAKWNIVSTFLVTFFNLSKSLISPKMTLFFINILDFFLSNKITLYFF